MSVRLKLDLKSIVQTAIRLKKCSLNKLPTLDVNIEITLIKIATSIFISPTSSSYARGDTGHISPFFNTSVMAFHNEVPHSLAVQDTFTLRYLPHSLVFRENPPSLALLHLALSTHPRSRLSISLYVPENPLCLWPCSLNTHLVSHLPDAQTRFVQDRQDAFVGLLNQITDNFVIEVIDLQLGKHNIQVYTQEKSCKIKDVVSQLGSDSFIPVT